MNDESSKYREVLERQAVEARDGNRFRWYFGTPITFESAYHCTRLVVDVEEPTIDQWREVIDKDMGPSAVADPSPADHIAAVRNMVEVVAEDANNYCLILTALGMEEEGDPVAEVERLIGLAETRPATDQSVATAGDGVTDEQITAALTSDPYLNSAITTGPLAEVAYAAYRLALASPSAPRVGVREGWEDIATAPNDGTPHVRGLHVYGPDGKYLYWEEVAGHIDPEDGVFYSGGDVSGWDAADFTHWHPLAAAPEVPCG